MKKLKCDYCKRRVDRQRMKWGFDRNIKKNRDIDFMQLCPSCLKQQLDETPPDDQNLKYEGKLPLFITLKGKYRCWRITRSIKKLQNNEGEGGYIPEAN